MKDVSREFEREKELNLLELKLLIEVELMRCSVVVVYHRRDSLMRSN